jgi:hypothetical protein
MSTIAIENNNIQINLLTACNQTGWNLPGDGTAVHTMCNAGLITNFEYPVTAGQTYQVGWVAVSCSSGNVQLQTPGSNGVAKTAAGVFVENVTPTANGFVQFYSNANCVITGFTIANITNQTGTTIVYSAINKKWSDFRTFYPDFGWSLFENTITAYQGQLYFHENGTNNTNNFYGTAYQSIIETVFAKNAEIVNTFDVLSYQANMLLVTTQGGIRTPLGQQTTLVDTDFRKAMLTDGVTSVTVYQNENVYSASLLNDENDDVINGTPMMGNYIIVAMQTVDGSTALKLFSMSMKTSRKFIGNR